MEIEQVVKSKIYIETANRIKELKGKLEQATADQVLEIAEEKAILFSRLRKSAPILYSAFHIDDSVLSELISAKLIGIKASFF